MKRRANNLIPETFENPGYDRQVRLLSGLNGNAEAGESSLVTSIAETIAREIVTGRYPAETVLSSIGLSERFSTSRTPVREAMLILEHHGLVTIPARRQPRVAGVDRLQVREIYAVQAELLRMKFELCAQNADDGALQQLRKLHDEMIVADTKADADAYFWLNIAFHDVAAEACGNMTLKRILEPLRLRTLQLRRITLLHPDRRAISLAEHGHLITACERREAELAGMIIQTLYLSALVILEERLQDAPIKKKRRRSI